MNPIIVLGAVQQEIELAAGHLDNSRQIQHPVGRITEGFIGNRRIVCCAGGVGKANAASAATALMERYNPEIIINTGCGGAYPGSGLTVGDLAVASEEYFADEGVLTPAGWKNLRDMDLPLYINGDQQFYNSIPLSRHASEKVVRVAALHGVRLIRGRFVTVSTCSGTRARGHEIAQSHQAVCESMEGAAVALACLRYDLQCIEIRGISNLVEDRDVSKWDFQTALEASQRFVLKVIEDIIKRPE